MVFFKKTPDAPVMGGENKAARRRGLSSSFHHHFEWDKKKTEMGNFEAFLPAVQSGKTCIRRAKASPWGHEQINQAIGDCRQRL